MDFENPPSDPVAQLREWLADAEQLDLPNPNTMCLATADSNGKPSARMVLIKALDERGAVFYTNYDSRKATELERNARAALVFHWDALTRQVVIEGRVSRISAEESDAYFSTRPRASQIGAWASRQSDSVADRATLDAAFAEMEQRYEGGDVPRPPHWGGYRVSLERMVFWQGRPFRLHDRVEYTPDGRGGWTTQRLFP